MADLENSEVRALAREVLTAHWTAFERRTPEAADVYTASLERGTEDADTAVAVLDEMARMTVHAIVMQAASRDVPYEDALADVYRQIDELLGEDDPRE